MFTIILKKKLTKNKTIVTILRKVINRFIDRESGAILLATVYHLPLLYSS